MKVYKVTYHSHQSSSQGFSYHSNKVKAQQALAKFKRLSKDDFNDASNIEELEIPITAKGIIGALNRHASHNDNG